MRIFRFQHRRFYIFIIFFIAILFIVHFLWNNSADIPNCFMTQEALKEIDSLLSLIQEGLKALNLSYFLCYNSLWGALKNKGPLPWQNSLELCVLNKEISAIDEGFLARSFKRYGLSIGYNSAGGYYRIVKFTKSSPAATLTVFEKDLITNQMRRVGWIHRLLPPNSCEELNCFPPELIAEPLPTVMFGEHFVPVPKDGIEIQKYMFPYSWWKEITPPNCEELDSNAVH